jgi:hypothetical protein
MTPRSKLLRFFTFGIALAGIIGAYAVTHQRPAPRWAVYLIAAVVVAISARWFGLPLLRRPVTPNPEAGVNIGQTPPRTALPAPGSRRWARALYHNGVISIEELVSFCASHPVIPGDPDNE